MSATQSADVVEVYRVEHRTDGSGPYNPRGADAPRMYRMAQEHQDPDHPGPYEGDEFPWGFDVQDDHFFGFQSLDLLTAWFDGWLADLDRAGYRVATYKVPADAVVLGRHQCVFERDRALNKPRRVRMNRLSN
jgi:hypothetical protein